MLKNSFWSSLGSLRHGDVFRLFGAYYCVYNGKYYKVTAVGAPGNFVRGKRDVCCLGTSPSTSVQVVGRLRRP